MAEGHFRDVAFDWIFSKLTDAVVRSLLVRDVASAPAPSAKTRAIAALADLAEVLVSDPPAVQPPEDAIPEPGEDAEAGVMPAFREAVLDQSVAAVTQAALMPHRYSWSPSMVEFTLSLAHESRNDAAASVQDVLARSLASFQSAMVAGRRPACITTPRHRYDVVRTGRMRTTVKAAAPPAGLAPRVVQVNLLPTYADPPQPPTVTITTMSP